MSKSELAWRSLHDLGLATWFGSTLYESVALPKRAVLAANGSVHPEANGDGDGSRKRRKAEEAAALAVSEVESVAMRRWSPVLVTSLAAHLAGGLGLLVWNRDRVATQKGVAVSTVGKGALTAAAVGLTFLSGRDGAKALELRERQLADGDDPAVVEQQQRLQRRMRTVGSLLPLMTGGIVVMNALHGEQQRPREMGRGILATAAERIPLVERIPGIA